MNEILKWALIIALMGAQYYIAYLDGRRRALRDFEPHIGFAHPVFTKLMLENTHQVDITLTKDAESRWHSDMTVTCAIPGPKDDGHSND